MTIAHKILQILSQIGHEDYDDDLYDLNRFVGFLSVGH